MGLGGILILLLLLVSLSVFIYVLVLTARSWGVLHTVLLSILFIQGWVFMVFAAGVQYRRVNATRDAHDQQVRAEAEKNKMARLLWGDFGVSPEAQDAVVLVRGQLRRLTADRGRVWRRLDLVQSDVGSYQLELSVSDVSRTDDLDPLMDESDAGPAAPRQPTSVSLPVDTIVYAFAEDFNEDGRPIPVYYLGEFKVTSSQAGQVSLQPTLELFSDQQELIASGGAPTWTLYELLPLDSHETFAAPGSQPSPEEAFGRMDEESIRQLFANVPDEGNRQQALVASYLRDGGRATDDDPEENVWVQVNVLKDYEVDVDSKEVANATERGYFDSLGRSIDSRLKRSKEDQTGTVKLTSDMKGKSIILRYETAQPLIASGVMELDQRVYIRPLNDYEEAFNQQRIRDHQVTENLKLTQRDSDAIRSANLLGQEMINFRQVENQRLRSELSNYQKELAFLEAEVATVEEQYQKTRAQLSQLYRMVQSTRNNYGTPVSLGN